MPGDLRNLSPRQRELLAQWLPGARVENEHSWSQVPTTVLEMTLSGARFIIKAGGAADHHIARELHGRRSWLMTSSPSSTSAALRCVPR